MLYEQLRPGETFTLACVPDQDPKSLDYLLTTEDGHTFKLRKFPYQVGKPVPETIECRIKDETDVNGEYKIGFNLVPILAELYKPGQVYDFTVKNVTGGGKITVEDSNKLFFRVRGNAAALGLRTGDGVRCRFTSLEGIRYNLELADKTPGDSGLPMTDLEDVCRAAGLPEGVYRLASRMMAGEQFEQVRRKRDAGAGVWLLDALGVFYRLVPEWLTARADSAGKHTQRRLANIHMVLDGLERVARYLLDGSSYLRTSLRRQNHQRDLTEIAKGVGGYRQVADLLSKPEAAGVFIDDLLRRLKESGYLYRPGKQFQVLMMLFRSRQELVNKSMGDIFNAILGWELDNWKVEPFRSAFVEQLELFINERRTEIDNMSSGELLDYREGIIKIVTALAIQSLMCNPTKDAGVMSMSNNRALFFRYLSLLRKEQSDVLLNKAWLSSLGYQIEPEYDWRDTKQMTMLITKACVPLAETVEQGMRRQLHRSFIGETSVIEVSPEGLSLRALSERPGDDTTWPAGLLEWQNLRVMTTEDIGSPNRTKMKDIKAMDKMWANIERLLFAPETADLSQVRQLPPDEGDTVRIRIVDVMPGSDGQKFKILTLSEDVTPTYGVLSIKDIVDYKVRFGLPASTFTDPETGEPLEYYASVKKLNGDGTITVSLTGHVDEYLDECLALGDSSKCVITNDQYNRSSDSWTYTAVSEKGYTLLLTPPDGMERLSKGDFVQANYVGTDKGFLIGTILTKLPDTETLDTQMAVTNLVRSMGLLPAQKQEGDEEDFDEDTEPLSVEQVRELIHAIRLIAVACHDAVKANNYLAFAGCMARTIGDTYLEDICREHRRLMGVLQYFVVNKKLEDKWDDNLDTDLIEGTPVLANLLRKIRLISYLNTDEPLTEQQTQQLMLNVSDTTKEALAPLSRLVLSYRMLAESGMSDQLDAILQQIRQLLNINTEEKPLKFYFDETQYTEFKSSYVFQAKSRNKAKHSYTDSQETEIMQVICGFLNTTGGTLYIGVNDNGYECGLDNDLRMLKKSLDKLVVEIDNKVRTRLGSNAGNYVQIERDTEAKSHDVLAVTIKPSPSPVRLDNKTIYVRQSTSTVPMTGDAETVFLKDRAVTYSQALKAAADKGIQSASAATEVTQATEVAPKAVVATEATTEAIAEPEHDTNAVATSTARPNLLHDYEGGFPEYYVYFTGEDELKVTKEDQYLDLEPGATRLTLGINADETNEQLVLGYAGGTAVRVPMRELLDKDLNKLYKHYNGDRLMFAAPIKRGEALLSVHTDSKDGMYYRVTGYDELTQGSINAAGASILSVPCKATVAWDVIPAEHVAKVHDGFNYAGRSIGKSMRASYDTPAGDKALQELRDSLKG